jgi:hypothetical protein
MFRLRDAQLSYFGFQSVGIPLAVACHSCAIVVALAGVHRFWKQQTALARGKIYAGGWELNGIYALSGLVSSLWSLDEFVSSCAVRRKLTWREMGR